MADPGAEEFEALLWDLPDPSDCSFLAILHEIPPSGYKTGASPEVWTEDYASWIEEWSSGDVTTGNLSVPGEPAGSCDGSGKAFIVKKLFESASSPRAQLMKGFSPADSGERSSSEPAVSGIGAIESLLLSNDEVEGDTLQAEDAEIFHGLLEVLADDPSSSSADLDARVPDRSVDSVGKESGDASAGKDEEDSDPMNKKRKRQLRNKDSALRSRERKKMYVKELEAKSRFMEFECQRLQQALALCSAENHALRLHVHLLEANRGVTAKQESAVLRMESLLLGSLLWLATFVWWVLFPAPKRSPEAGAAVVAREEKGAVLVLTVPTKRTGNGRGFGLPLSPRFKAARKKMRADYLVAFVRRCRTSLLVWL